MSNRGDIFGSVPIGKIGRTNFNLSHQLTGNFKEAICYPVLCSETLPGDSWKINVYNITKLETLLAPAMQRTDASILWFKIPQRLCMKNFKKWYSGGIDGKDSTEKPYIKLESIVDAFASWAEDSTITSDNLDEVTSLFFGPGSIWQCLGLPIPIDYSGLTPKIIPPIKYSSGEWQSNWSTEVCEQQIDLIPFTAYQLLYDDFFRDQTLSDPVFADDPSEFPNLSERTYYVSENDFITCDGSANVFEGGIKYFIDVWPLFMPYRRAWKKDYFTSALPTPQRGPEVTLDMLAGTTAPVEITNGQHVGLQAYSDGIISEISGNDGIIGDNLFVHSANGSKSTLNKGDDNGRYLTSLFGTLNKVETGERPSEHGLTGTADLSGLSPITIVALRNLFKLQAFMEKNNVAGGRYIEYILAHWAERVPDFTVQRPQFVRATKIPVIVSEVTATANSSGLNSQVGDQGGRAKAQGNLGKCRMYTQEPSIILAIYCVTIPPAYVGQGIPKMFQRMSHWDCPYAEFQHIGEQAIANKEIFLDWLGSSDVSPDDEFGYQQRYSEFKYLPDRVIGDFAANLAYWNQARIFTAQPALNQEFIEQNPSERIFAVANEKPVIADFWFDINCSRKLSKYSTPKLT